MYGGITRKITALCRETPPQKDGYLQSVRENCSWLNTKISWFIIQEAINLVKEFILRAACVDRDFLSKVGLLRQHRYKPNWLEFSDVLKFLPGQSRNSMGE
jgi:hypothetical protein